jgi:hypothetical protein
MKKGGILHEKKEFDFASNCFVDIYACRMHAGLPAVDSQQSR